MNRTARKGARDMLVLVLGTVAAALAERAVDFGIPAEAAPVVGAIALFGYRLLRDRLQGQPV